MKHRKGYKSSWVFGSIFIRYKLYPKQFIFSVKMIDEIILVDDNSSSAQLRKDLNLKPKFKLYEMFICIQNALKENL